MLRILMMHCLSNDASRHAVAWLSTIRMKGLAPLLTSMQGLAPLLIRMQGLAPLVMHEGLEIGAPVRTPLLLAWRCHSGLSLESYDIGILGSPWNQVRY